MVMERIHGRPGSVKRVNQCGGAVDDPHREVVVGPRSEVGISRRLSAADDCVGGPALDPTRVLDELAQIPTGARCHRRGEIGSADD